MRKKRECSKWWLSAWGFKGIFNNTFILCESVWIPQTPTVPAAPALLLKSQPGASLPVHREEAMPRPLSASGQWTPSCCSPRSSGWSTRRCTRARTTGRRALWCVWGRCQVDTCVLNVSVCVCVCVCVCGRAISVLLGEHWKKMRSEDRRAFTLQAKALADEQKRLNPDCWKRKRTNSVRTHTHTHTH